MVNGIFDSVEWGKTERNFRNNYPKASLEEKERLKTWLLNQAAIYKKRDEAHRLIEEMNKRPCAISA